MTPAVGTMNQNLAEQIARHLDGGASIEGSGENAAELNAALQYNVNREMRLFTGLDLPGDLVANLEELLAASEADRADSLESAREPSRDHQVHRRVAGRSPGGIEGRARGLPSRAVIPVHIRRVGFFPNPHSPRIFWCGIEAPGLLRTGRRHRCGHRARWGSHAKSGPFRPI